MSGKFADDKNDEASRPTMRREPLPPAAIALYILLNPQLSAASLDDIGEGELVRSLKGINAAWVVFLIVGICALSIATSNSLLWRIAVPSFVTYITVFAFLEDHVNRVLGEILTSALMVWASVALLWLIRSPSTMKAVTVGVMLGALALSKAFFLYISFVTLILVSLAMFFISRRVRSGAPLASDISIPSYTAGGMNWRIWKLALVSFMSFSLVVAAWATRNAAQIGEFRLTDRGGDVFMLRMLLSELPVAGLMYVFSPKAYKEMLGPRLGYSQDDIAPGGRLEAFNREDKSLRIHNRRWDIYRTRIEDLPARDHAQGALVRASISMIVENPTRYIASIGVFAYRGSFFTVDAFPRPESASVWVRAMPEHFSLLMTLNFVLVTLVSLGYRRPQTFVLLLIPVGMYLFLGMFSHNISRYNLPAVPFAGFAAALSFRYLAQLLFHPWLDWAGRQGRLESRRADRPCTLVPGDVR